MKCFSGGDENENPLCGLITGKMFLCLDDKNHENQLVMFVSLWVCKTIGYGYFSFFTKVLGVVLYYILLRVEF